MGRTRTCQIDQRALPIDQVPPPLRCLGIPAHRLDALHPELVKEASSQSGVTAQHHDLVVLMGQRLHKRPPNESCATSNNHSHTSLFLPACPKPPTEQSAEAKDKRVYPAMHRDHLRNGDRPRPCRSAQSISARCQHGEKDRRTRDK